MGGSGEAASGARGSDSCVMVGDGSFTGVRARKIVWRSFSPAGEKLLKGAVTIAHGYGEHGGRYEHVAERLTAAGYVVYVPDHHGHGRSGGKRGRVSLEAAVTDLDQLMVTVVRANHRDVPQFMLGHSLGGTLALRYCMRHQRRLQGLIITSPLAVIEGGGALKLLGSVLGTILPGAPTTRIEPRLVSRDQAVVKEYIADPLNYHGAIPAGVARAFIRHTRSLPLDVRSVTLPTLLIWGTADRLCPPAGAEIIRDAIGSQDLTATAYPGLFHEIMNEPERELVLDQIVSWLDAHAAVATGR